MIQQPQLVVCRAGVPAMLTVGTGYLDDGLVYELVARTRPFAPSGHGRGEAVFRELYITTTTYDQNISLYITPYVDFAPLATQRMDIVGAANGVNQTTEHRLFLSVPIMSGGVEVGRVSPRGNVIDVRIETKIGTLSGSSARQIVDGIEVDYYEVEDTLKDI